MKIKSNTTNNDLPS